MSEGRTEPTQETRDLVVTVTLRYPLRNVIDSYAEAISPDGGFTGTVNVWIEDYAKGFIAEMTPGGGEFTADWRLSDA